MAERNSQCPKWSTPNLDAAPPPFGRVALQGRRPRDDGDSGTPRGDTGAFECSLPAFDHGESPREGGGGLLGAEGRGLCALRPPLKLDENDARPPGTPGSVPGEGNIVLCALWGPGVEMVVTMAARGLMVVRWERRVSPGVPDTFTSPAALATSLKEEGGKESTPGGDWRPRRFARAGCGGIRTLRFGFRVQSSGFQGLGVGVKGLEFTG